MHVAHRDRDHVSSDFEEEEDEDLCLEACTQQSSHLMASGLLSLLCSGGLHKLQMLQLQGAHRGCDYFAEWQSARSRGAKQAKTFHLLTLSPVRPWHGVVASRKCVDGGSIRMYEQHHAPCSASRQHRTF